MGATERELRELGDIAERRGCLVLVDEAFRELAWEPPPVAATLGERFLSTNTLTKCYGLAGLRTGWLLGPEAVVARALTAKKHTSVGQPVLEQRLALAAMAQRERLLSRARSIRDANFPRLKAWLAGHALVRWVEPDGGPICAPRLPEGADDMAFARRLVEDHGVLVTPGCVQGLRGHFRVGFGCEPSHLEPGLRGIDAVLGTAEGEALEEHLATRGGDV